MPNIVSQCREWIPTSTSERTGGLKKPKCWEWITPTTGMIKILTVLLIQGVEGHTHGQFVWKQSPVKSSKQEFSSNVSKRSSAREKNEPTTSKNFNWPSHWKLTRRFPQNFVFWFTELFLVVLNFLSCKFVTTLFRILKKIEFLFYSNVVVILTSSIYIYFLRSLESGLFFVDEFLKMIPSIFFGKRCEIRFDDTKYKLTSR